MSDVTNSRAHGEVETLAPAEKVARLEAALKAAEDRHQKDSARIASLERLIREERAQYVLEQRRAADAINKLKGSGGSLEGTKKALASAKREIQELSRYKRQVERLENSPLYGPAHRVWSRFKAVRGYRQNPDFVRKQAR